MITMIYLLDSIAFVHVTNEYYDSSSPQNAASTVLGQGDTHKIKG